MQPPFITIPETTLPNDLVVPSFQVSRYLAAPGEINPDGATSFRIGDRQPRQATISVSDYPWTRISFHEAVQAATAAGYKLITETQALAIAWLICQQDSNWTGGKVGEGDLYQGLHADTVDCPQPASFDPPEYNQRRWHDLPNGERIYDFAGNAFSWIFDDIHGDENGIVSKRFEANDISLQAPFPAMEKGMGWRPDGARDWSGDALLRGGCWDSESFAGAFRLSGDWPDDRGDDVGFRCTHP